MIKFLIEILSKNSLNASSEVEGLNFVKRNFTWYVDIEI